MAGIGTLAAVIVSLHLARKGQRIQVRASVGIRLRWFSASDGTPAEENVCFTVVNLGDRAVTVVSVGWRIGNRKNLKFCIQPLGSSQGTQYPKQLAHGEQATFLVSFSVLPCWPKDFATGFVGDLSKPCVAWFTRLPAKPLKSSPRQTSSNGAKTLRPDPSFKRTCSRRSTQVKC